MKHPEEVVRSLYGTRAGKEEKKGNGFVKFIPTNRQNLNRTITGGGGFRNQTDGGKTSILCKAAETMTQISIVVPVFNEEKGLNLTIQQLEELMNSSDLELDVIFVNDGSTDKTTEILNDIQNPSIKVIHHDTNRGYGAALKTGIQDSSSPYICITDADGSYPIYEISNLASHIDGNYSMIVGARTGQKIKIPILRRFPKWILNKLANYLTSMKIPDINSGLRIMKKEDIEYFKRFLPNGFSFTTTITLAMLTNNRDVLYLSINYHHRKGSSKIRPIYDTLNFFQLIIRTCMYFDPLRIFIPFALLLFCFAFLVLGFSHFFLGRIMDVTFGIILMTAVIVTTIGMLADLIDKRLG
jgi:glycosyltransferase involved in cell wall biosynthesis